MISLDLLTLTAPDEVSRLLWVAPEFILEHLLANRLWQPLVLGKKALPESQHLTVLRNGPPASSQTPAFESELLRQFHLSQTYRVNGFSKFGSSRVRAQSSTKAPNFCIGFPFLHSLVTHIGVLPLTHNSGYRCSQDLSFPEILKLISWLLDSLWETVCFLSNQYWGHRIPGPR